MDPRLRKQPLQATLIRIRFAASASDALRKDPIIGILDCSRARAKGLLDLLFKMENYSIARARPGI